MEGRLVCLVRDIDEKANPTPWRITNNPSSLGFRLSDAQISQGAKVYPLTKEVAYPDDWWTIQRHERKDLCAKYLHRTCQRGWLDGMLCTPAVNKTSWQLGCR